MKKLFISCPMKGRTEENIKKSIEQMHKIAEIIFDQELEVIPSYIEHRPPENNNRAVWYLGASIQMLSEADFFIGIEYSDYYNGCRIEAEVARCYGIKSTFVKVHEMMPDVAEIERKHWGTMGSCIPVEVMPEGVK